MNRWPFIFVVLGLLAAGLAYERVSEPDPISTTTEIIEFDVITPAMSNPPHLDSAWYCPMGSSDSGGFADHEIYISNLAETSAVANLSILTAEGQGAGRRIELAPMQTERVQLSGSQESPVAGAVVEIISGEGVVGHAVTTDHGRAEGPCATQVSNRWFFASGRTELDSKQYMALMNPFPETAVFNVEFRTLARSRQPQALQGASVPARSVRIIDIGENITSEANVATIVTTQRGRLIAERLQVIDGSLGANGAALQLGVARPASSWIMPAGRINEGGDHSLIIFNPAEPNDPVLTVDDEGKEVLIDDQSETTAVVDIQLWPNNPADLSLYGVVTTTREIRPGSFETIDIGAQAIRFGFPLPYELGVNVLVQNDLPVVVERWQVAKTLQDPSDPAAAVAAAEDDEEENADAAAADGEEGAGEEAAADADAAAADGEEGGAAEEGAADAAIVENPVVDINGEPLPQPTATAGLATSRGVEQLSTRWIVPWVSVTGDSTSVVIVSPEEASVEVRIMTNGGFVGPTRATVPRGGRTVVPIALPAGGGGVIEVTSDVPVAVEAMTVFPDESLDVVPAIPTVVRS
ncbi:MAG: DUF5719 family protein [Acidimicrobiia bacterium]|nr:DUF5719 family protein [Acidimicrobiia bacterium]MDH5522139.1 DUF5719 family protein [Acidimicrobiia bacterium]